MNKFKLLIYILYSFNILFFLALLFIEFYYSDYFEQFNLLAISHPTELTKIEIFDSDADLYTEKPKPQSNIKAFKPEKISNTMFLLSDQKKFWSRWQYSLLASMQDKYFYSALSQVKNIRVYNSGFFSDSWMKDIYQPILTNKEGKLDLEVLIITWVQSDLYYKVTLQYDFYYTQTNKRYLEHVVNIIFSK